MQTFFSKVIFFALIAFSITAGSVQAQPTAQDIIKNVQAKYSGLNDAKASFSQTVGKSSSSGTIYIGSGNKYRIETGGQIVVTDGSTSWNYSPKKKQVVIDNYKEGSNSFSPNKFLFSYPENFYSDLDGEENVGGAACYVIKLNPRKKGSIKSAKIWIDKNDNLIRKVTISGESTSTYVLKNIELNAGVSSSKFSFDVPNGVQVVDLR